jgi:hypothetical protein
MKPQMWLLIHFLRRPAEILQASSSALHRPLLQVRHIIAFGTLALETPGFLCPAPPVMTKLLRFDTQNAVRYANRYVSHDITREFCRADQRRCAQLY